MQPSDVVVYLGAELLHSLVRESVECGPIFRTVVQAIHTDVARMLIIAIPIQWIFDDVLSYAVEIAAIPDDVFVIPSVPERRAHCPL